MPNIIQMSDHDKWGQEYVIWGARIVHYGGLWTNIFNLKIEWDSGEALTYY